MQFLAGSGRTFNVEERASIQSSLHMLKAEQVLGPLLGLAHIACGAVLRCGLQGFARVQLWGKLFGQKTDYIIAQGIYQVCILQAGLAIGAVPCTRRWQTGSSAFRVGRSLCRRMVSR